MTPEAIETINGILDNYKAGIISREAAVFELQQLFKREPVNYKRTPTEQASKPNPTVI